ncbi:unnamed protein product [Symbiodinium sp. CCMP2592]|nr:unnamed protein product [Symbiodinium sp. CCMP2592]
MGRGKRLVRNASRPGRLERAVSGPMNDRGHAGDADLEVEVAPEEWSAALVVDCKKMDGSIRSQTQEAQVATSGIAAMSPGVQLKGHFSSASGAASMVGQEANTDWALQHSVSETQKTASDGTEAMSTQAIFDRQICAFVEVTNRLRATRARAQMADDLKLDPLQKPDVARLQMENEQLRRDNTSLKLQNQALHRLMQALPPAVCQTAAWIRDELPRLLKSAAMQPRGIRTQIPILALRHTHKSVNAALAFGDDHENAQENILKLFDQLFRGHVQPHEVEELQGKLPPDVTDDLGIRSRNNRRLLALRALQSCRLDECIYVPCIARSHEAYLGDASFKRWFDKGDDGDSGWSIHSREGQSKHRGVPIFNNAAAAKRGLKRLAERQKARANPDWHRIEQVESCLREIKLRPVSRDNEEETLSFYSRSEHAESSRQGHQERQWDGDTRRSWGNHGHADVVSETRGRQVLGTKVTPITTKSTNPAKQVPGAEAMLTEPTKPCRQVPGRRAMAAMAVLTTNPGNPKPQGPSKARCPHWKSPP